MNKLQQAEFELLVYFDEFAQANNIRYSLHAGTLLGAIRHKGFIPWDDDIDVVMRRSEFDKFEELFLKSDYFNEGYTYQSIINNKFYVVPYSKLRNKSLNVKENLPKTQEGNYGPWIDIFAFDNVPDDEELRRDQFNKIARYNKILHTFLLLKVAESDTGIKRLIKSTIQWINEKCYKAYFFIPLVVKKRQKLITMYNEVSTKDSADLSFMHYRNFEEYDASRRPNQTFDELMVGEFEGRSFPINVNYDLVLTGIYGDYMTLPPEEERVTHDIVY